MLDRDIKKKVLRAGCLAQLRPPRAANCLLPGLITSLCYSVNARRKPLCLPRLNSCLAYICIYIHLYMHIYIYIYMCVCICVYTLVRRLNASSRTRINLSARSHTRERERRRVRAATASRRLVFPSNLLNKSNATLKEPHRKRPLKGENTDTECAGRVVLFSSAFLKMPRLARLTILERKGREEKGTN